MSTTPSDTDATVDACLRVGHGFHADERERLVEALNQINRHLVGTPADEVTLEIHVKDRDHAEQRVTLEGQVPGLPLIIASHATDGSHDDAEVWRDVTRARDEFIRQLDADKDKRRPNHRH